MASSARKTTTKKKHRTCVICGADINHLRSDAKTCSDACRQALKRQSGPPKKKTIRDVKRDTKPVTNHVTVQAVQSTQQVAQQTAINLNVGTDRLEILMEQMLTVLQAMYEQQAKATATAPRQSMMAVVPSGAGPPRPIEVQENDTDGEQASLNLFQTFMQWQD